MAATPRATVLACMGTCGDGSDASGTSSPQTPTPAHRTAPHAMSMADRIEWAPRWWPCASAAATLAPRRRPRRQHVRVVRRRPRHRREHVLARASTRPSSAPRIDGCAASGHLAHVARGRTQHCASTAAATTIARTRCRQRPHLGAAAPVALCRRRRHHMGVGRRWQPPQGPQCSPDRAHVGRVAPGASTDASHGDGRRLDNRPQLVDAEAVDPHRHSGTMAPHRQPRCPPVHVVRRRPPHRREHGLTRARARPSRAPASMAATPVAIRPPTVRGRTWHCASTAGASVVARTRCRQVHPPRRSDTDGLPLPTAAIWARRASPAATPGVTALASEGHPHRRQ